MGRRFSPRRGATHAQLPRRRPCRGDPHDEHGLGPGCSEATRGEIVAAFLGKTLQFENGDTLAYARDGGYTYTALKTGRRFAGRYAIGNGVVCVQFTDGGARCDTIVKDGRFFMFVNAGDKDTWQSRKRRFRFDGGGRRFRSHP